MYLSKCITIFISFVEFIYIFIIQLQNLYSLIIFPWSSTFMEYNYKYSLPNIIDLLFIFENPHYLISSSFNLIFTKNKINGINISFHTICLYTFKSIFEIIIKNRFL